MYTFFPKLYIGQCRNTQLLHISMIELKHIKFKTEDPYNIDNIQIIFHNNSRLYCDVKETIDKEAIRLENNCKLI